MREKIAKILTRFEGTAFYPYSSSVVEALSQEILNEIRQEVKKMESSVTKEEPAYYRGFEDAQEAFLKALEASNGHTKEE